MADSTRIGISGYGHFNLCMTEIHLHIKFHTHRMLSAAHRLSAVVKHGLNCENHTFTKSHAAAWFSFVCHHRALMESFTDAVTEEHLLGQATEAH